MGGINAKDTNEAIYINEPASADGVKLNGKNKYILRLEPMQIPVVPQFENNKGFSQSEGVLWTDKHK